MKTLIVDDEPKAISLIAGYLRHYDNIEVVGTFRTGLKALQYINQHNVDLVFLDINMPELSGMSLAKLISKDVKVIFTTAYSEYAVESYEIIAVDYLLKPIQFERFAAAMRKLENEAHPPHDSGDDYLFIKSGNEVHRILISTILYLQKDSNYMVYQLRDKKVIARASVAEALEQLPDTFIQVHKSFIVDLESISSFTSDEIRINDHLIPIGRLYKNDFMRRIMPKG